MNAASNIDAIVAPQLASVSGTVSARLEALRARMPSRELRGADAAALDALLADAAPASAPRLRPVAVGNPGVSCAEFDCATQGGASVHARLIAPAPGMLGLGWEPAERAPLVLMFHDAGRPVRGWHHMARFAALGYTVLALDAGVVAEGAVTEAFPRLAASALALAEASGALPGLCPERICTWGEGVGGALAILVAAAWPERVAACAACNPYPADDARLAPHLDIACLAPRLQGGLLVGTALLDELAPAEAQAALVNGAVNARCARQVFYPKFTHERINDFEDEVLRFLRFE